MLGVVAATDKTYLLETLARWILDRTDKETAFAANFAFMRIAAANRIITSCALTNMATGALVFLPGADYPVMALAQVGMLFELAAVFGRGIKPERGYEVAGVLAGGLVIRAVTARSSSRRRILGLPLRRSLLPRAPMAWAVRLFRSTSAMSTTAVPTRWSLPRSPAFAIW